MSFSVDDMSGPFETCKEKNNPSPLRRDFNLKWDNHAMVMPIGEKQDAECFKYDRVSLADVPLGIRDVLLSEADSRLVLEVFSSNALRIGETVHRMIRFTHPLHEDDTPSMRITVIPFT